MMSKDTVQEPVIKTTPKRRGPYGKKKTQEDILEIPEKILKKYDDEISAAIPYEGNNINCSRSLSRTGQDQDGDRLDNLLPNLTSTDIPIKDEFQEEDFGYSLGSDIYFECSDPDVSELGIISSESNTLVSEEEHTLFINEECDLFDCIEQEQETDDVDCRPLFEGSSVTTGAFMLLLALFIAKHNITGDGIQQLLNIISLVLPTKHNLSSSLQTFKNYFRNLRNPLLKRYYCPACLGYIKDSDDNRCTYKSCGLKLEKKLPYFLEVPVIEQIRSKFSQHGFFENLQGRFRRKLGERYEDIYDGTVYQNLFVNNGPLSHPENISFTFNTDGAPVFKSNNTSIWPIFMVINELPYRMRMMRENMIIAGLWFGQDKPSMSTFLKPFQQTMCEFEKGIEMKSPERGTFNCRGFALACTADLPARSLLCNSVQFNGSFGCWKCLQKGNTAKVGKGHTHVFPFNKDNPKGPLRTTESVYKDSVDIIQEKKHGKKTLSVNGVKGPSWLILFPKFHIIEGIAIDYMHGVLLGVQKLLLRLWFSKEFSSKEFSFYARSCEVDELLQSICPTSEISRLPRSLSDLKYWKASEYRAFLLYYGAPVLGNILDVSRFNHYLKLIHAVYYLLKQGSSKTEVNKAEKMLFSFCEDFSLYYDECYMTLNIHQLVHLADSVRNLGPLFTHSCFSFEDKNGFVLKTIRGTQNIDSQILTGISFVQKLPELKEKCIFKGTMEELIFNSIDNPNALKRGQQLAKDVFVLGAVKIRQLEKAEFDVMTDYLGQVPYIDKFTSFNRIEFKQHLIYGTEYARMIKRNNSTVMFKLNSVVGFGQVRFFCELRSDSKDECQAVAFLDEFFCKNYSGDANILAVRKLHKIKIVPVSSILSTCIFVNFTKVTNDNSSYICLFPNKLEFD